jgi:RNA polymerase sigma-70 factor (ECF subfamily)
MLCASPIGSGERSEMAERELDRSRLGDHVDRLYRAAWAYCGSREEAEDLVQETLVRVLARPRLLRKDDDLGYLLRALRNTFLTGRRAARRRPVPEPLEGRFELLENSAARTPDAAAEAREVYGAIADLPETCRDVLVAIDVAGLSYRETARALRISIDTVTSRLYRARRAVAARVVSVEPERTSARDHADQPPAAQTAR